MGQIVPDAVEAYLSALNRMTDSVLDEVSRAGASEQLPLVDAEVGALLRVLATTVNARRILEIGTAIGYSGIWLARALPADGQLILLEITTASCCGCMPQFNLGGTLYLSRMGQRLQEHTRRFSTRQRTNKRRH